MHGTFKILTGSTENFVGAIGLDNKTLYCSYEQGFLEGKIIDKDTIQIVYRHVTPTDSVVAVGVWTRGRNRLGYGICSHLNREIVRQVELQL